MLKFIIDDGLPKKNKLESLYLIISIDNYYYLKKKISKWRLWMGMVLKMDEIQEERQGPP